MEPTEPDRYRPWRAKHFEAAEIDSLKAPPGVEDYLENAFLYRRIPPVSFNGEPVDTTMRWFAGSSAAFLHAISRNPGMTGRRKEDDAADSMDGLLVCFISHGRVEVETDGQFLNVEEGAVFTLDTSVPHVMRNYPGHVVAIFLARSRVTAAVDTARLAGIAGRVFTGGELADLFALHVRYMVDALGNVSPATFDIALTTAADVAVAMIRQAEASPAEERSHLVARAKTIIATASADPELNTAKIAAMLNVSRTSLYDAFADQGLKIATYLRDHRLRAFLQLLRSSPTAPIQDLARAAGFGSSASDFTKLFRRVYGTSPSDMRATLLAEKTTQPD
ncbi:hypothetical protein ASE73_05415 [Sphingomonas sp. Leaf24]|uniref:AraC family transcriptional regulator n=1 Tax=unclassified Sphingomonas TaxID=196159 RepID=UPI0006F55103|nr:MULTISPECIES: helix-turn-helix domain-containing protein [unclassified Sphingomonas]KQM21131.1 hypothetical protein ASE50_14150 [Sphingomonas sp. Leaf5]KQM85671.1 hypothetical protein ASE70_17730 [Sphingomonas sp. Leaf22]KQM89680.1 hypothetical protein ASE73_05415 [Sphingomonas sp. Leaf24]KQN74763.1 hypothetical protein ASE91_17020 [Sphingomonas sp. Leaf62]KQN89692.1 hypothetical protein ASE90_18225 [Sphingomonas sp. Leaf67]